MTLSEFVIRQILYADDVFTFFLLPIYVKSDLLASCYEYKNFLFWSTACLSPHHNPSGPLSVTQNEVCFTCRKGRHTRSSFFSSAKSDSILRLLIDVSLWKIYGALLRIRYNTYNNNMWRSRKELEGDGCFYCLTTWQITVGVNPQSKHIYYYVKILQCQSVKHAPILTK